MRKLLIALMALALIGLPIEAKQKKENKTEVKAEKSKKSKKTKTEPANALLKPTELKAFLDLVDQELESA